MLPLPRCWGRGGEAQEERRGGEEEGAAGRLAEVGFSGRALQGNTSICEGDGEVERCMLELVGGYVVFRGAGRGRGCRERKGRLEGRDVRMGRLEKEGGR